ncbi:MAG: hypothetical protein ACI80K_002166, partial [Paracoccaceae bacterium]
MAKRAIAAAKLRIICTVLASSWRQLAVAPSVSASRYEEFVIDPFVPKPHGSAPFLCETYIRLQAHRRSGRVPYPGKLSAPERDKRARHPW